MIPGVGPIIKTVEIQHPGVTAAAITTAAEVVIDVAVETVKQLPIVTVVNVVGKEIVKELADLIGEAVSGLSLALLGWDPREVGGAEAYTSDLAADSKKVKTLSDKLGSLEGDIQADYEDQNIGPFPGTSGSDLERGDTPFYMLERGTCHSHTLVKKERGRCLELERLVATRSKEAKEMARLVEDAKERGLSLADMDMEMLELETGGGRESGYKITDGARKAIHASKDIAADVKEFASHALGSFTVATLRKITKKLQRDFKKVREPLEHIAKSATLERNELERLKILAGMTLERREEYDLERRERNERLSGGAIGLAVGLITTEFVAAGMQLHVAATEAEDPEDTPDCRPLIELEGRALRKAVAKRMKELGLSKAEVAQEAGLREPHYMSRWFKGPYPPGLLSTSQAAEHDVMSAELLKWLPKEVAFVAPKERDPDCDDWAVCIALGVGLSAQFVVGFHIGAGFRVCVSGLHFEKLEGDLERMQSLERSEDKDAMWEKAVRRVLEKESGLVEGSGVAGVLEHGDMFFYAGAGLSVGLPAAGGGASLELEYYWDQYSPGGWCMYNSLEAGVKAMGSFTASLGFGFPINENWTDEVRKSVGGMEAGLVDGGTILPGVAFFISDLISVAIAINVGVGASLTGATIQLDSGMEFAWLLNK